MQKFIIFRILLGAFLLGIAIVHFINYLEYSNAIKGAKPITYQYISKKINSGRRSSYEMTYLYQTDTNTISITKKEFALIDTGSYPVLYYSDKSATVFSNWAIQMNLRISIALFVVFVLAATPWEYIANKRKLNKATQHK